MVAAIRKRLLPPGRIIRVNGAYYQAGSGCRGTKPNYTKAEKVYRNTLIQKLVTTQRMRDQKHPGFDDLTYLQHYDSDERAIWHPGIGLPPTGGLARVCSCANSSTFASNDLGGPRRTLTNDRIGLEVVAGWPHRMMIGPGTIVAEEGRQPMALDDVPEVMVERPPVLHRLIGRIEAEGVGQARHVVVVQLKPGSDKLAKAIFGKARFRLLPRA